MSKAPEKNQALEAEIERLKREINETYRGVAELTNELATGAKDRDISELRKEISFLSLELEETYRAVTELANELYQTNTALQKSQAQLELALEGANLGLWEWYLETGELTVNNQWYGILAYSPSEIEANITTWEKLIHPDDLLMWNRSLVAYLKGEQSSFHIEYRLLAKSGQWLWVMVSGQGKRNNSGKEISHLAGIMMDIDVRKRAEKEVIQFNEELELRVNQRTKELEHSNKKLKSEIEQRKQTEEQLQIARAAAEKASEAKSVFLANMSHELRTPLNAILGFSKLMQQESLREKNALTQGQKENLDIIHRSGEHLLTLINNVLDLSKIEAGKATLNATNFDLYQLLNDLIELFSLRASKKSLQLLLELPPEVPQFINTDMVKLKQVLMNLLSNALKFTEQGSVVVKVSSVSSETECQQIHFEVEDTGPGIPVHELKILFQAFTQTTIGRKTKEGTGLGLTISREFVELMGGKLEVKSKVNKGSVFFFTVNVEVVEEVDIKERLLARQIVGLKPHQPSYKILVVDDNETNRQLLVRLLQPLDFNVREAIDGLEAVQVWEEWQPHLIWMDIRMPVMDGYLATKIIRSKPHGEETKIIALTASKFEDEKVEAMTTGCNDYFRKPFREEDIFEAMHNYLGVEYIYEEVEKEAEQVNMLEMLASEEFRAIPKELLVKLERLAILADIMGVGKVIAEVSVYNEGVARALTKLADNFEYSKIVEFIKIAKEND